MMYHEALVQCPYDFKIDLTELESLITPQTKLIVLTNLHNPGAAFLDNEILQGIAAIAQKYRVKVLIDEVFHDFVEEKQPPAATLDEHFISLNSLSKVYGVNPLLEEGLLIGSIPSDGCTFFPKIVGIDDTAVFTRKLADQYRVYVAPGHFFGAPKHIRIGFGGASEELEIGSKLLANAIRDYEF